MVIMNALRKIKPPSSEAAKVSGISLPLLVAVSHNGSPKHVSISLTPNTTSA